MMRVLVLEDEWSSQEITLRALQGIGISNVTFATNGTHGLKILDGAQEPPDLILCDVFMPEMDGIEFVTTLAERGFAGKLIFITGMDPQFIQVAQTIAVGAGLRYLGAVFKPLTDAALLELLSPP